MTRDEIGNGTVRRSQDSREQRDRKTLARKRVYTSQMAVVRTTFPSHVVRAKNSLSAVLLQQTRILSAVHILRAQNATVYGLISFVHSHCPLVKFTFASRVTSSSH